MPHGETLWGAPRIFGHGNSTRMKAGWVWSGDANTASLLTQARADLSLSASAVDSQDTCLEAHPAFLSANAIPFKARTIGGLSARHSSLHVRPAPWYSSWGLGKVRGKVRAEAMTRTFCTTFVQLGYIDKRLPAASSIVVVFPTHSLPFPVHGLGVPQSTL